MHVKDPNVKLDYEDDVILTEEDSFSPPNKLQSQHQNHQPQQFDFKKRNHSKTLSNNQKLIKKLINKNPKL